MGGVLGIIFGSAIGLGVHWLTGFPVSLPWWSFALGIGFSASVGIFFGLFPAFKASRLDPIEALTLRVGTQVFEPSAPVPAPRPSGRAPSCSCAWASRSSAP